MIEYGRGIQKTRDEIGGNEDTNLLIKRFSEKIALLEGPTKIEEINLANDTIWGLFNWGEKNWDNTAASLFVLGSAEFGELGDDALGDDGGEPILLEVINTDDTFIDWFDLNTFVDASNTTADTSTPGQVDFTAGEVLTSTIIAKDTRTFTGVTINTTMNSGSLSFQIQADGTNWEDAEEGVETILTDTGEEVKYKASIGTSQFITSDGDTFLTSGGDNFLVLNSTSASMDEIRIEVN